jgi:hypothetical protein
LRVESVKFLYFTVRAIIQAGWKMPWYLIA